jgi:hypothetical protein
MVIIFSGSILFLGSQSPPFLRLDMTDSSNLTPLDCETARGAREVPSPIDVRVVRAVENISLNSVYDTTNSNSNSN